MGYKELAYAIVNQAVCDYRKRKEEGMTVTHLVKFFKSEWCDNLLVDSSLTGKDILAKLEKEE